MRKFFFRSISGLVGGASGMVGWDYFQPLTAQEREYNSVCPQNFHPWDRCRPFWRIREGGYELCAREFQHSSHDLPSITLVAVSHTGRKDFYSSIAEFSSTQDAVLLEGVQGFFGYGRPENDLHHYPHSLFSFAVRMWKFWQDKDAEETAKVLRKMLLTKDQELESVKDALERLDQLEAGDWRQLKFEADLRKMWVKVKNGTMAPVLIADEPDHKDIKQWLGGSHCCDLSKSQIFERWWSRVRGGASCALALDLVCNEDRSLVAGQELERMANTAQGEGVSAIAAIYGAAHMPTMQAQLESIGYRPHRDTWRLLAAPESPMYETSIEVSELRQDPDYNPSEIFRVTWPLQLFLLTFFT